MSRAQLIPMAALSLIATAAILLGGGRSGPSMSAVRAALVHRAVVHASLPQVAAAPAPAPAATAAAPVDDAPVAAPATADTAEAPVSTPAATTTTSNPSTHQTTAKKPAAAAKPVPSRIRHVFLIALDGPGADTTFGPQSTAPYLAKTLRPKGTLLTGFHPLDGADLPNYLAAVGGQPPNADTKAECATYGDFPSSATPSKAGIVPGDGCVYPNTVITLGDQLTASAHQWRAYLGDMANGPQGDQPCRHPAADGPDPTLTPTAGDEYVTRHNPFVYFHSLLDLGDCQADDLSLDKLTTDLGAVKTTPNLAYIAPNLCASGAEATCADGSPGGLPVTDAFLATWVPKILASPAYKQDGLLMVVFLSGAPTGTAPATATTPAAPATPAASPPETGALLVSRFAKAGATDARSYDPYSVLRSTESIFGLTPLAKAASGESFAERTLGHAFP